MMEYRLGTKTFGGLKFGAPLVSLRSLGRCDVVFRSAGYVDLVYRRYGIIVNLDMDSTLLSVEVALLPDGAQLGRFRMSAAKFRLEHLSGEALDISSSCSPLDLTAFLGEPIDQFESVGQLVTQYVVAGSFLQFSHTKDGAALAAEISEAADEGAAG
jgi:hypothetical protein